MAHFVLGARQREGSRLPVTIVRRGAVLWEANLLGIPCFIKRYTGNVRPRLPRKVRRIGTEPAVTGSPST